MYTFDCTIVTDHRWLDESNADWYACQVWVEDAAVREALERRGWKVHRTNWDDASFNWSTTRYAMIRSTWITFIALMNSSVGWKHHRPKPLSSITSR